MARRSLQASTVIIITTEGAKHEQDFFRYLISHHILKKSSTKKNPSINVTYGIELEGLCSKVDGSIHIIDGPAHGSGADRWLSAGEGTGASGKGKEGGGGLHGRIVGFKQGNGGLVSYR